MNDRTSCAKNSKKTVRNKGKSKERKSKMWVDIEEKTPLRQTLQRVTQPRRKKEGGWGGVGPAVARPTETLKNEGQQGRSTGSHQTHKRRRK